MKKLLRITSVKLVFSILFLTLIYTSCKKDKPEPKLNSSIVGTSISSAKESFEAKSKTIKPDYTGESFLSKDLLGKRKLDWDNAFSQSNGDTVAVFVPVILSARITLVEGGKSGVRLDNLLYLRLMTISKEFDGSKAEMITMIPDQIWEKDTNFSGHMFIENWFEPNLSVVSRTRNSVIPTNSNGHKPGDKVVNGFPQCYTAIETACVGAGDGQTCYTSTHTACAGGGGGNGGSGGGGFGGGGNSGGFGGGGGGTGTPGGGGGGAGGTGNGGAKKISTDISITNNAKAKCALQKLLNNNSVFDALIKEFMGEKYNLNFKVSDKLNSEGSRGQTTYDPRIPKNYEIVLRESFVNSAPTIHVVKTLLHEAFHANLMQHAYDSFGSAEITSNWTKKPENMELNELIDIIESKVVGTSIEGAHHEYMAKNINRISDGLIEFSKKYDSSFSGFTDNDFHSLAYEGLHETNYYQKNVKDKTIDYFGTPMQADIVYRNSVNKIINDSKVDCDK